MKIFVTGATGNVGGEVVRNLVQRGAEVRVLVRKPGSSSFPAGVDVVAGDLTDPDSIRRAVAGAEKLFLLNAVVPDELTQALTTYDIARQAGIQHVTYVSVYQVDRFHDVPHFASKAATETAIREFGVPYTILRPGYFFQNDLALKPLLLQMGVYAMPIGSAGISAVDVRDIAEAAAISLTEAGHENKTYDLVSSSLLDGASNAALWSRLLGKEIAYAGHDFDAWEKQIRAQLPGWMAYDMRSMLQGYFERGFTSAEADVKKVAQVLGHAPRTYEAFAREAAAAWLKEEQQ